VLNLLLGWTLVGWVAPLAWALASPQAPGEERLPCPHCAEPILTAARVCHFCRRALPAGWSNPDLEHFIHRVS